MQARKLIVLLVTGTALAAGLMLALRDAGGPASPKTATILPAGNELPQFALLDQHGAPADRAVFTGQWDLVFFGFTHCPDICPATMTLLAQVRRTLESQGREPLPRLVLVSVDPERDTPEAMATYLGYFGNGNLGLTGDVGEIRKLADALGIFFEKSAVADGNYGVDHSAVVLLINPEGRLRALFTAPHRVEDIVHDLPLIMESV